MSSPQQPSAIEEIVENFALLDEWDDRYRYVIELGRALLPLPDDERTAANKVQGCVSQVWLSTTIEDRGAGKTLVFRGDSDAHIVRGLVAILIALMSDRPAAQVARENPMALFEELGLAGHLTPQRSNGFRSMVRRMQADAEAAMEGAA